MLDNVLLLIWDRATGPCTAEFIRIYSSKVHWTNLNLRWSSTRLGIAWSSWRLVGLTTGFTKSLISCLTADVCTAWLVQLWQFKVFNFAGCAASTWMINYINKWEMTKIELEVQSLVLLLSVGARSNFIPDPARVTYSRDSTFVPRSERSEREVSKLSKQQFF